MHPTHPTHLAHPTPHILAPMPTPADERPMGRTYALVILCHAAVITSLWWLGHTFSR